MQNVKNMYRATTCTILVAIAVAGCIAIYNLTAVNLQETLERSKVAYGFFFLGTLISCPILGVSLRCIYLLNETAYKLLDFKTATSKVIAAFLDHRLNTVVLAIVFICEAMVAIMFSKCVDALLFTPEFNNISAAVICAAYLIRYFDLNIYTRLTKENFKELQQKRLNFIVIMVILVITTFINLIN